MKGFPVHVTGNEVEPLNPLTDQQRIELTDDFVANKSIVKIKHDRGIPRGQIVASFTAKKAVSQTVLNIMKSEEKPATLAELKSAVALFFPNCSQAVLDYNIDKIVEVATPDKTWDAYKAVFE